MDDGEAWVVVAGHPERARAESGPVHLRDPGAVPVLIRLEGGRSLRGRVTDTGGKPLRDAEVAIGPMRLHRPVSEQEPERVALTGPDGHFELHHVSPGAKGILVRCHGRAARIRTVAVPWIGPVPHVDFTLPPGVSLRGEVVEAASSRPIAGVRIGASGGLPEASRVEALTADDGSFVVPELDPGLVWFFVHDPDWRYSCGQDYLPGPGVRRIHLEPEPRLRGCVVDARTGAPVTAFRVAVGSRWTDVRSADGRFDVPANSSIAGRWDVHVEAPAYAPVTVRTQDGSAGDIALGRGATVTGRIVDRRGMPVPGVRVQLKVRPPESICPGYGYDRQPRWASFSDADGRFAVTRLPEAAWIAGFEHPSYVALERPVQDYGPGRLADLGACVLDRGASVHGTVMRRDGSAPDSRANVLVSSIDPARFFSRSARTGDDGRFEISGLLPGRYQVLCVEREGVYDLVTLLRSQADPVRGAIEITEGQRLRIDF